MPASVANAAPSEVFPASLYSAFGRSQEYLVDVNEEYPDGSSQRAVRTSTSRKSWMLAKRITAAQLATLEAFYLARKGATEAFYFYDLWETSPLFTPDPTGAAVIGRYTVRFDGYFESLMGIGRVEAQFSIVELA